MSYIPFPPLSPEIFTIEIGGVGFALRWYALAYIGGIFLGWRIMLGALKRPKLWLAGAPMRPEQVERMMTWIVIGIIVGGRLGFVFFYQPDYYLAYPLRILQVWQGGMSFHGGFLGVVMAAFLFARHEGISPLSLADLLALATPPGLFLGRIANFINAELWGRPTDLPWAVAFPGQAAQSCGQLAGQICARHPSQLYEALLEGALLGLVLLYGIWRKKWLRQPGRTAGVFFMGYGAARFIVEFVRQPDAQFITLDNPVGYALQLGSAGLTMGQLLCVPMFAAGLVLVLRRR